MADTAALNPEPALPEDRKGADLQSKTFADAVEQGPAVDETVDAKSGNAPQSENETNGTHIGLEEESIENHEPIGTEGIANGKVNDGGDENMQKMELGDKVDATAPETNGSDEKKSHAGAVCQPDNSSIELVLT